MRRERFMRLRALHLMGQIYRWRDIPLILRRELPYSIWLNGGRSVNPKRSLYRTDPVWKVLLNHPKVVLGWMEALADGAFL